MANVPLSGIAAALAAQGRFGDTELLHVNRAEVDMLAALSPGGLTVNPVTGQREAFLPFLIPLLAQMGGPAIAGALGLTGTAAALTPAVLSGLGTWAATGDPSQGLISGLTSGLTGGLGGGAAGGAEGALTDALSQGVELAAADAATSAVTGAATDAVAQDAVTQAIKGAVSPAAAADGGILSWMMDNPMLVAMGASMLPGLTGGGGDERESPPYQKATPVPRSVVPYSSSTAAAGPSTYVAGDDSENDSPYRYGQYGGEHMFFDPIPNASRPALDPLDQNIVDTPFGSMTLGAGGIGDIFAGMSEEDMAKYWSSIRPRRRAYGGPVTSRTTLPFETPRPAPMLPVQRPSVARGPMMNRGLGYYKGGPVNGPGTSTSDSIPAVGPGGQPYRLSNGEYILPAWMVSAIGGGSNEAGAAALDGARDQGMKMGGKIKVY